MFHIGEKIVKLRKEKNMTQDDLSNLLKVSRQTISKWETEVATPDISNLILISDVLDCSIDYLVKENENRETEYELDKEHLTFGERIIKLRKKNHITQEQFAEYLKISRQSIFKWEKNMSYPEIEKLIQVSALFNCSLDYLLKNQPIDNSDSSDLVETNNIKISKKYTYLSISYLLLLLASILFSLFSITYSKYFMAAHIVLFVFIVLTIIKFVLVILYSNKVKKNRILNHELYYFSIGICLIISYFLFWLSTMRVELRTDYWGFELYLLSSGIAVLPVFMKYLIFHKEKKIIKILISISEFLLLIFPVVFLIVESMFSITKGREITKIVNYSFAGIILILVLICALYKYISLFIKLEKKYLSVIVSIFFVVITYILFEIMPDKYVILILLLFIILIRYKRSALPVYLLMIIFITIRLYSYIIYFKNYFNNDYSLLSDIILLFHILIFNLEKGETMEIT